MSTKEQENLTLITNSSSDVQTLDADTDVDTSLITTLPMLQQRFIHLYLTGKYTHIKLAELLNTSPNTIGKWLKKPIIRQIIEEMQVETHQMVSAHMKNLSIKATERLYKLMDSPVDGVALQAVNSVLDRTGHKAKQEIKIDKTVTTVEQKMKQLIDESIIDAEVIDCE